MTDLDYYLSEHVALSNKHNEILIRSISVTDSVLRQQLNDEYLSIVDELDILQSQIDSARRRILLELIQEANDSMEKFYDRQFTPVSLIDALNITNNIDVKSICKKYRLKEFDSLENRRELCIFLNTIQKQLIIYNLSSKPIETIGRFDDSQPLKLYCRENSSNSLTTCIRK